MLVIGETFGKIIEFRVLALELELVLPVGVIEIPLTVVAVALVLAFVNASPARAEPVEVKAVSASVSTLPEVLVLVMLSEFRYASEYTAAVCVPAGSDALAMNPCELSHATWSPLALALIDGLICHT